METWFGQAAEGSSLQDYLEPRAKVFAARLRVGLDQTQEGFLPRDLCLDQMPRISSSINVSTG